ncbi:MAG: beta-N-acetylhexosaminidase [Rhodospirillales bacterium]|nr:beta-N-acetylhexosaminidase [Rhodospirillales bacterium]
MGGSLPRAAIFGLAGPVLSGAERQFFADCQPLGFILFARNCVDPGQVRALVCALRAAVGREDAPVLIDQEGGRVQRLGPPHWRAAPPPGVFGALAARDERRAIAAAWLNARLIAADLADLGITVDCTPLLDVRRPEGHAIIGDRAFSHDGQIVALLGRATCAGLIAGGVLPVIKHIPGHGRATLDSHESLPVVGAEAEELERCDFAPFAALADMPLAMTAHVVFSTIDPLHPATTSPAVVGRVIREGIGFDGLLISDDLCMRALAGTPAARTHAALAAGCDVVLHCNGDIAQMQDVAKACPSLTSAAQARLERAQALRAITAEPFDAIAALTRLENLIADRAVA